jgi:hypothetical protein
MSDLEGFSGMDAVGDGFSAAAFEKFKERMKAAATQLKALQAGEQKQKKTEDELIKILLKFITSGKKRDVLMLVLRLLEMNVPAGFIVSLLLISNADIQQELKISLLPAPEVIGQYEQEIKSGNSLLPAEYAKDQTLPLKVKISIDSWIREIARRVNDNPHKILEKVFEPDRTVNLTTSQLGAFCLRDYLESEGVPAEYSKLKEFIELIIGKILNSAEEELLRTKALGEGK